MYASRLLWLCLFLTLLLCGLSQSNKPGLVASASLYNEANDAYNKGLQLSTSDGANEAAETALNKKALDGFVRFLNAVPKTDNQTDALVFDAALKAGELEHYFDSFSKALHYYNLALSLKQALPNLDDSVLFKPCLFAGLIYYNQNQLDSATAYLKKAETIQAAKAYRLPESERLYNILGSIYYQYGNYKQAKNYFQKAAETLSETNPSFSGLVINYKMNEAASLLGLEQYDSARVIYQSLLPKSTFFQNQLNNQLGLIQLRLGMPRQALHYFEKITYGNEQQTGLFGDVANAYLQLKEFDSVRYYVQLAITKNKISSPTTTNIDFGRILKIQGDLQKETGHLADALRYYQRAMHQFYPAFRDTTSNANPTFFSGAFSYINLFQTLAAKAETMEALYHVEGKSGWADQSLETYAAAFSLMAYVEQTYESDEARLFLTRIKYALHSKPIDLAFERYQQTGDQGFISLLYAFDQQNKAAVLALNRQQNTAIQTNASPLVQKEQEVKKEITRLSIKASKTSGGEELTAVNNAIRDHEIELGKLRQNLYPQQGRKSNIPSLQSLQDILLDNKTVMISYHLSTEKLTSLVITKKEVRCYQQPLPTDFTNLIGQELISLRTAPSTPAVRNNRLYKLLLANVPLAQKEQLIVIPDDVLAYLPFEILQNEKGNYLIEDLAVQYQFSTVLLAKDETDLTKAETLSFAPFATQSSDSFSLLPRSAQEIEAARGKRFFDTAATKEKFLAYSASFPIVHLATHAVADNSSGNFSYIAFAQTQASKDNLLYAQEIYNLRLQNTGLLILSACETGTGNLIKGEGVLSLSRAFAYAGCPNVITSLWQADDFSTAYLSTRIHRYLAKSYTIAKATQQAKIDYLNDKTINPRLKHPYYWAHLVFIGNYAANKSVSWWWPAAVFLLLVVALLVYITKSRKAGL